MRKLVVISCLLLTFFLESTGTCAKSTALKPDIIVALDGTGDFTKIQDAVNAAPSFSERPVIIFIKNGFYNSEKLLVPADKRNITFLGESREETIISYHLYNCSTGFNGRCPAEDAALWPVTFLASSATLTIQGDGFRAENLTIQNTAGPVAQAQALAVQADRVVFINCDIKGYQDTLYLWTAGKRSYFENCLIIGRTDYIYGAGIAFFQSCEIRSWGKGWITAPSTPENQDFGFVFNKCNISYAINSPRAGDDSSLIRLGRPWHEYPKVAWLFCEMTVMINPEGWGDTWRMDYAATSTGLHLYEYKNTGPGADMSNRAKWAGLRALTDSEALNYTVQKVLGGPDGWDPTESRRIR
jgi:pectinesterase